jgi:hypothetical protein
VASPEDALVFDSSSDAEHYCRTEKLEALDILIKLSDGRNVILPYRIILP